MSKIEYKYPLDVLVSNVFKIFHILWENGSLYADESISLVLLVLSMYKDDLIKSESMGNHDSVEDFRKTLVRLSNDPKYHESYGPVVEVLSDELSKINSTCFTRICYTLCELDKTFLKKEFISVFDDVLYRFSKSQGKKSGESLQPAEISHLILSLIDFEKTIKVFNPFAGVASYGILSKGPFQYYGQEKNAKTWAIGTLRIMAYGKKNNLNYVCEDSISNWPQNEKFDLIISTPPFGLRLGPEYHGIKSEFGTIEAFYIKKGLDSLHEDGKLLALFPESFLYNDIHKELRKDLVENYLIESIVTLPGGLLSNTSISTTVLVLNKKKKLSGKVKLVNGHYFLQANKYGEKNIDYLSIVNLVKIGQYIDQYVRIVDSTLIKDNEYNLSIPRYFRKQIDGARLGELLEIVNGSRNNIPNKGKLVKISDLKDDKLDFILDMHSVETTDLNQSNVYCISESCLLLASRWRTLKPTYFEYQGENVYLSKDILSFKINEILVDTSYLINELNSDYVQEQLERYNTGGVIPMIRKADLMDFIIKLPPLEEQKIRATEEKLKYIQQEENKIKNLRQQHNLILEDENSVLRHRIGGRLNNLIGAIHGLSAIIESQISVALPNVYDFKKTSKSTLTFGNYLDILKRDIAIIENFVSKDYEVKNDESFEDIDIIKFLKEYFLELCSSISNKDNEYRINPVDEIFDETALEDANIESIIIHGDESDLKIMFDNIEENAVKHGFKDQIRDTNKLDISCEIDQENMFLKINFANSGNPLPKDFTKNDFIRNGITSDKNTGDGYGGNIINKIVSNHKGELIIENLAKDKTENELVTRFTVRLPIKDIVLKN